MATKRNVVGSVGRRWAASFARLWLFSDGGYPGRRGAWEGGRGRAYSVNCMRL